VAIKVALEHRTSYTFDRLVEVHPHVVRLRPAPHTRTPIEAYTMDVEPADHFINWQQDAFGNFLARLVFPNPTRSLTISVGLIADLKVINPFDFFIEEFAETVPFRYPDDLREDLEVYLRPVDDAGPGSGPAELLTTWVRDHPATPGMRTIDFLVEMEEGRSLLDHAALILDLERLLKRSVDVASERGLRRVVRKEVLKDAIAL